MTGSLSEAEDVAQEARLRLERYDRPDEIRDLRAWLATGGARSPTSSST